MLTEKCNLPKEGQNRYRDADGKSSVKRCVTPNADSVLIFCLQVLTALALPPTCIDLS